MEITVQIEGLQNIDKATGVARQAIAEELAKGMYAVAKKVEGDAKRSIMDGQKSGRIYRRGKSVIHRASAPGEAPANDTGRLVNSINGVVDLAGGALQAVIKAGSGVVRYARMLEFGTARMAARPFLFPATEKNRAWITERINKAVRTAIIRVSKR